MENQHHLDDVKQILELKIDNLKTTLEHLIESFEQHKTIHQALSEDKLEFVKWKYQIEATLKELTTSNIDMSVKIEQMIDLIKKSGDFMITVKNGVEKEMWISDVVIEMYTYMNIFKKYSNEQLEKGLTAIMKFSNTMEVIQRFKIFWVVGIFWVLSIFRGTNIDLLQLIFSAMGLITRTPVK